MKATTDYDRADLCRGKCRSCGDRTLITDDGRCPQCVEDAKFYEMTMRASTAKRKGASA